MRITNHQDDDEKIDRPKKKGKHPRDAPYIYERVPLLWPLEAVNSFWPIRHGWHLHLQTFSRVLYIIYKWLDQQHRRRRPRRWICAAVSGIRCSELGGDILAISVNAVCFHSHKKRKEKENGFITRGDDGGQKSQASSSSNSFFRNIKAS